jgi:predicted transcriptional regulator
MITGEQVTQARELLRWSIVDLAHRSGVHRRSILAFEVERQRLEESDVDKIKTALERAGVDFTNGAQPSVRLRD